MKNIKWALLIFLLSCMGVNYSYAMQSEDNAFWTQPAYENVLSPDQNHNFNQAVLDTDPDFSALFADEADNSSSISSQENLLDSPPIQRQNSDNNIENEDFLLNIAIQQQDPTLVKQLLDEGSNPGLSEDLLGSVLDALYKSDRYGESYKKYRQIANLLIDNPHTNLNGKFYYQPMTFTTPLFQASMHNDLELLEKMFATNRLNINQEDQFGGTILDHVHNKEIINFLTKNGAARGELYRKRPQIASVQNTNNTNNPQAQLFQAVSQGDNEAVLKALELGADINAQDPHSGLTPLISAAIANNQSLTQLLLNNPLINPNKAGGEHNNTALHYAVLVSALDSLQELLSDPRILVTQENSLGQTARDIALTRNYNPWPAIAQLLYDKETEIKEVAVQNAPDVSLEALLELGLGLENLTPEAVLKVGPHASQTEINKAYKELIKKWHPDKYEDKEIANEITQLINWAKSALQQN